MKQQNFSDGTPRPLPDRRHDAYAGSHNEFDFDVQACSATDCTGLIPSLPLNDAELESYNDIYPFEPKAHVNKKANQD